MNSVTPEKVQEKLNLIADPELGFSIIDLGLVYDIAIRGDQEVSILMTLTSPACPEQDYFNQEIPLVLKRELGIEHIHINFTFTPPWSLARATEETKASLALMGIPVGQY